MFVLEATECVKIVHLSCGFDYGVNRDGDLALHLLVPQVCEACTVGEIQAFGEQKPAGDE